MLQARTPKVSSDAERYLLVYMIGVLIVISGLIIIFFVVFQKRKNKLLLDKLKQQRKFDAELVKTQREIQEETLKHIGRELHDNVGQRLVLATMQMNAVASVVKDETRAKIDNAASALKESLDEVRALSRSLNSDVIFNLGFEATVKNELERINKTGLVQSSLSITGNRVKFENKRDEVILFRILQEFFSNTLKYGEAENLNVTIDYQEQVLKINLEDDGVGFDVEQAKKGSGLINMETRSDLLNAEFQLQSQLEKGTVLSIQYPYKGI
ncbi:sensor histidine kinase [Winogradskyella sp. PC D3.3]